MERLDPSNPRTQRAATPLFYAIAGAIGWVTLAQSWGHHGQADLLRDYVARRLRRGPARQLRLGRARRGRARIRERAPAVGGHVSPRAPDVRGAGRVGDAGHR